MSSLNCYVVSYDIREQKRLCRVHKAMLGFGEPVHYSVFICHLSEMGRVGLIAALSDLIDAGRDRVMIIDMVPADGRAEERIIFLGTHEEKMEHGGLCI
jgi:CRISPR-associated protein Cas2